MSNANIPASSKRKQGSALSYLLIFVCALFIGILVVVYVITKRTNPIQLDEHGKPVSTQLLFSPISRGHDAIV